MSQKFENILIGNWRNLNNFFLKQFSILLCKIFYFGFVNKLLIKKTLVYIKLIYKTILLYMYQYILVLYILHRYCKYLFLCLCNICWIIMIKNNQMHCEVMVVIDNYQ